MAAGTQRCLWSSPTRKQSPVWRLLCQLGRLGLALTQRRKKKSPFLFAIGETWRKTFSAEDGAVAHGTAGGPRGRRAQSLAVPPSHAHGPGGSSGGGAGVSLQVGATRSRAPGAPVPQRAPEGLPAGQMWPALRRGPRRSHASGPSRPARSLAGRGAPARLSPSWAEPLRAPGALPPLRSGRSLRERVLVGSWLKVAFLLTVYSNVFLNYS